MRKAANPQPALGAAIRQLRGERGLTQEALAHEAQITVGHLSTIERGRANPSWGAVTAIAGALGMSMVEVARCVERQDT
jgi:transcriptional regulator with XRE-family HTH domain